MMRGKNQTFLSRAAVIVWTAIMSTVILGFAALAIDLGYLRMVKGQMQNTADTAAMAGVSALINSSVTGGTVLPEEQVTLAQSRAKTYASRNPVTGKPVHLETLDITVGNVSDPNQLTVPIQAGIQPYNAVGVIVRKSSDSENGPVDLFFAGIWGKRSTALSATAVAFFENRLAGYKPSRTGGPLIPITVSEDMWNKDIVNKMGSDNYSYDSTTSTILQSQDEVCEISIYPHKENINNAGSGNFGVLDFGESNPHGTGEQILNGLTEDEFIETLGTSDITFYGETGQSKQYPIEGTPGLEASLTDYFSARIGEVVGFFTHTLVSENGQNTIFSITGIQFGRIMAVKLHGNNKAVVIQPATYTGSEIISDDDAHTHPTGGKIELIR